MDPNYSEFEKTLVNQLEASIQIEPDRFTVMTPEEREKYIKQKHREILEEEKKKRYFFAMRKKNTDTDTSIVMTDNLGRLHFQQVGSGAVESGPARRQLSFTGVCLSSRPEGVHHTSGLPH